MAADLDTLELARRLKEAGVGEAEAEMLASTFRKQQRELLAVLASKDDLNNAIEKLELRLTIKLGAMIGAAAVGLGILMKLL